MDSTTFEWVIGISTTFLGVVLSDIVTRLEAYREIRQRADLKGRWLSISDAGEHNNVKDEIAVSISRGKLRLINVCKTDGYDYEATCTIRDKRMVVGSWRSVRPGASAHGQVLLLVDAQGRSMYGVYSGMHSDGRHLLLGWVLEETRMP